MTVPARTSGSGPGMAPESDATTSVDPTASSSAPVLVSSPSADELVAGAVATWRGALVEAAGGSTLSNVDLLGDAALDLSAAHPSGIAQLFAGRETRLSNLVREGGSLATAKRRARSVGSRAESYAQRYGIAPTYLAIGVATWTERTTPDVASDDVAALAAVTRAARVQRAASAYDVDADGGTHTPAEPRTVRAPVLLRPVSLRARGSGESDYELALEPSLEVNPILARALRSRGALLDPGAVARGAFTGTGFDPRPALDRLTSLGAAVLEDFELVERIVVGTFVHPGQVLVDDLDALSGTLDRHEVVAALAGVEEARAGLRRPVPAPVRGDRDPDLERGVGDLDAAQQHVLDVIATGEHLFVDAPTGSDVTGMLAAVVADAAASGRTVLYVPGHRRASSALKARLEQLGLDDLLLDVAPEAGWRTAVGRRLLGAMTLEVRPPEHTRIDGVRRDLVKRREQLRAYVAGLHAEREPWGVSAYDALQALARLTAARPAPRTTVRLGVDVARVLDAERRTALAADLARVCELGAFTLQPSDTPWFGADLLTDSAAHSALETLGRVLGYGLPRLTERVAEVSAATGLVPATTVAAWGEQLVMLGGIRGALDLFQPMIFERTAADLVAATGTKEWREQHDLPMGYWLRRRLRKQAKDMVRPGRPVADLHSALIEVQKQRQIWQAHCPAGGWPQLPEGLATIEDEFRDLSADLDELDAALTGTPGGAGLFEVPLPELTARLARLVTDRAALETLPARTALERSLTAAGLGDLLADLARRRVDAELVGAELELAWWSTVFEQILTADPALAGYDGATLGQLSAEYAAFDREHVASLSTPVRNAVVGHIGTALRMHRDQAEALFGELVEDRMTSVRETVARYPDVTRRLRPVLAASPMLVPQLLPASRTVDVVVIDAAAQLPVEVAVAVIARGRQVVVVGDARCASGTAVRDLADVLPVVALRADASRRDPYLTAFLAAHGYEGVLSPTPLPENSPLVRLDVVDGTGMPDATSGTVEGPRAEVEHVVELVLTHALTRPDESLAVLTPSIVHADLLREAVLAEVRANPSLAVFFDSGRVEPFVVADLTGVAGLRRDAVIFTLGYGRTPHGRVLHRFGPIGDPGGDARLLDALGATRHRLDMVASFAAADLDPARLRGPGARLLADLLAFAERRGQGATTDALTRVAVPEPAVPEPPMTDDAGDESTGSDLADGASGSDLADGASGSDAVADAAPVDDEPIESGAGEQTIATADHAEPDRLVVDLAERLWRHGLVVEIDHGLPGGTRIPLAVGHPDLPGRLLVAVLTDDEAYVSEPSIRVRDRQVADRLDRLGWSVVRVWSAAAFLDPQAEVDRIRRAVHATMLASPRAVAPLMVTPTVSDDDLLPVATETPIDGIGVVAPGLTDLPARPVAAAFIPAPAVAPAPAPAPEQPIIDSVPQAAAEVAGLHVVADAVPAATPAAPVLHVEQPTLAVPTGPRPHVRSGLPVSAYSDDELDEIITWITSDGSERNREELAARVREELGMTRRSSRVDAVVAAAVRRATR
ncbi:hypothetical protein DDP54_11205 [Cellulomonas sp. WB94]|uniref:ATP-binding protein n=1 Tax=Cellulomonas sp. WB94 TaxID=2173174 RepID=UPI000D57719F|nr:ATP-binding protein [Cellulomonas sp. WB94]PVU83469.1 hypothetical protein DDP54_11205 [Cellulomonas sp. WB94]